MNIIESTTVRRKPMKEQVFDVLHQDILRGRHVAGEWLRQDEIAGRLGVSMTPVREALDLLVSSGLAERVPYRGVRIRNPSTADILDSYGMRLLLEGVAAYAAATKMDRQQLASLWDMLDRGKDLVALSDMPDERALSRELHSAIVAAAGNKLLHRTYLTILNTFPDWMLYEHLYRKPELLAESMRTEYREHSLIVEALEARDRGLAVRRTIEHMTSRRRELEVYLGISGEQLQEHEAEVLLILDAIQGQVTTKEPL
jgi:DNA-binding GntR family transcriptional regulator